MITPCLNVFVKAVHPTCRLLDNIKSCSTENDFILNPTKTKDKWIRFHEISSEQETLLINDTCVKLKLKFKLL